MCSEYVASSASIRISDGCTLLIARWNVSRSTPPNSAGKIRCISG